MMATFKHQSLDRIDSIGKELKELQEKLLKLNVQAQLLEVDLATQFDPDTILEIKNLDQTCVESIDTVKGQCDRTQAIIDGNKIPNL